MRSFVLLSVALLLLVCCSLTIVQGIAPRRNPIHTRKSVAAHSANEYIQVGLVVETKLGDIVKCVNISMNEYPEATGYTVLELSGIPLSVTEEGAGVCAINGTGCNYPEQSCFCQCQSVALTQNLITRKDYERYMQEVSQGKMRVGGDCVYWAYYHLDAKDSWEYSKVGASAYFVKNKMVEGWKWSGMSDSPPKTYKFDDICHN